MSSDANIPTDPDPTFVYQIRLKGILDSGWADWFDGMTVTQSADGDTLITGPVVDQAALYGLLRKARDLGLPLVAVRRLSADVWRPTSGGRRRRQNIRHNPRRSKMSSEKKTARLAGLLYLVIFIANIFVFMFVSGSLAVPGDATATANNIAASESLYRSGVASYLIVFLSEIGTSILLYTLLRSVNKTVAILMTTTRLMQAAVHAVNLLNFVFPLILLNGGDYLDVFSTEQLHALVLLFTDAHYYGVLISEAFFSVSLFLLGYLLIKSELFPSILGVLLAIAGFFYVLDSFGIFLLPQYQSLFATAIIVPAIVGELAFTLWLLIRGVRTAEPAGRQAVVAA